VAVQAVGAAARDREQQGVGSQIEVHRRHVSRARFSPEEVTVILALTLLAGCSTLEESRVVEEEEVRDEMGEHWAEAEQMREAVIVNDLTSFHRLAGEFQKRLPIKAVPDDLEPIQTQLVQAVQAANDAQDLEAAGKAVGQMTTACATCHQTAGVSPELKSKVHPTTGEDPPLEMVGHHIAAANLWSALVRHDDADFDRAVGQLEKASFAVDDGSAPGEELQALEDRVQRLAAAARNANGVAEQGEKLGMILGTCGTCHKTASVTFP
jgi:cytochrome c553